MLPTARPVRESSRFSNGLLEKGSGICTALRVMVKMASLLESMCTACLVSRREGGKDGMYGVGWCVLALTEVKVAYVSGLTMTGRDAFGDLGSVVLCSSLGAETDRASLAPASAESLLWTGLGLDGYDTLDVVRE